MDLFNRSNMTPWRRRVFHVLFMNSFRSDTYFEKICDANHLSGWKRKAFLAYSALTSHLGLSLQFFFIAFVASALILLFEADDGNIPTYADAIDWSITVYTTIGYGHRITITTAGRVFTIIYAIVGIPVFFLFVVDIAICLRKILDRLYTGIKVACCANRLNQSVGSPGKNTILDSAPQDCEERSQDQQESSDAVVMGSYHNFENEGNNRQNQAPSRVEENETVPVLIPLVIVVVYILGFGYGVVLLENKHYSSIDSYGQAIYMWIITFTTIGFGDVFIVDVNIIFLIWLYDVIGFILLALLINVFILKFNLWEAELISN